MQNFGQKYLDMGFSIIPLGRITLDKNGSKKISYPIQWRKYQTTRPTREEVASWRWNNVGVVTGMISNIIVVDTDIYKPGYDENLFRSFNIPVTPVQQTARGGKQYFFKHPGFEIRNSVCLGHPGSGIDIRADGGMTILPPTKTTYGEYTWILSPDDVDFAELPQSILEFLKKEQPQQSGEKITVAEMIGLKEGEGRDNTLTSFTGSLIMKYPRGEWPAMVLPMVMAMNNTFIPPLPIGDVMRIYNSITNKEIKNGEPTGKQVEPKKYIKAMSFESLMSQEFPAARFTLDPYFETNAVNMVSAPPNTWKSWLLFLTAGAVASGDSLWNFKTEQSKVMIVNEEDTFRAVQDRFKLLDITDKKLPIYFHIAQGLKIDKSFVENILKEMKENGIKTLMLDSLRSMHEAEENDSTEMQIVLDNLKEISRNEITVIFTHHHRKRHPLDKQQSADASRGSSAINAAISGHISLDEEKRENGTFLIIHHLKSKAGPKIEPVEIKITKADLTGLMSFDYQGTFKSSNKKIEASKDVISSHLKQGGWMSVSDFMELEVASNSIIRTALRELKQSGVAMTMTRAEAKSKGIEVSGEGRANELVYAWCEGKDNELDTFASSAQTIDPNNIPL